MEEKFKLNGPGRGLCAKGCGRQNKQLNTYDYLADIPGNAEATDLVEVQFKNTRKGYYHNHNRLPLEKGDIVAVEATPGHDIGVISLTGRLVPLQIKKANLKSEQEIKRVYRKAKPVDLEKYEEAKNREHGTMIRSRQIAKELGLQMKIGDVEYQGDGNKAIFYYIADGRVDFRQLIKVLADTFHVRIEMKQIGARQEAGRIGGIGPCGRELCCATWMKNFVSVSTGAARYQDISLNPQKLAGQCAKLKCCMNYEVDTYVEAGKRLPSREITLLTQDAEYFFFKADILGGLVTYSTDKRLAANLVTLTTARVFEVINMNRRGEKPEKLNNNETTDQTKPADLVEQESLTRFDKRRKNKGKRKDNGNGRGNMHRKEMQNTNQERQNRNRNRDNKENRNEQNTYRSENRNGKEKRRRERDYRSEKPTETGNPPTVKTE
ncbi:regulatory iron-sulfur-containing complex subunit RicT [Phocaeicola sartorii]|uniref:PSP1 domain-containing protein n=1 Tax=Phocaeicola sartorii TaxID=671267 RepID=UPI002586B32E|nr:regulatory iron-sulfur-containing complex subunit RicT [Phocaeicola sartorii]